MSLIFPDPQDYNESLSNEIEALLDELNGIERDMSIAWSGYRNDNHAACLDHYFSPTRDEYGKRSDNLVKFNELHRQYCRKGIELAEKLLRECRNDRAIVVVAKRR